MSRHSRKRILMVDDDDHLLVTLTDYLRAEGFDVIQAANGKEALGKLDQAEPDLIILDIGMPEMSGLTFLKQIASAGGAPRYPVLIFTAKVAMENFFSDIAIEGFIPKPCSEAELLRRIRDVLDRHARKDAAGRKARKLLLAESDEHFGKELIHCFEGAGYSVELVHNGAQVLASASMETPDVILMKDSLPRVTGTTMAAMISTVQSLKLVPIVIYDNPAPCSQVRFFYGGDLPPGVSRYLLSSKPDALINAVNEVCAQ